MAKKKKASPALWGWDVAYSTTVNAIEYSTFFSGEELNEESGKYTRLVTLAVANKRGALLIEIRDFKSHDDAMSFAWKNHKHFQSWVEKRRKERTPPAIQTMLKKRYAYLHRY